MATATKSRSPKQVRRTMCYLKQVGILFINDRQTTAYFIDETSEYMNADEHARSFHLTKTDGEMYDVLLDGPGSQCDCQGFERFGMNTKDGKGCKHVAALALLQKLGRL